MKTITQKLVLVSALIAALAGSAVAGPNGKVSDGGGNVDRNGNVLDIVEDDGLTPLDIVSENFYKNVLKAKLENLNLHVNVNGLQTGRPLNESVYGPLRQTSDFRCGRKGYVGAQELKRCRESAFVGLGLGDFLKEGLGDRKWYLETNEIISDGCRNKSMIQISTEIAACQDQFEVRISKRVWDRMNDLQKSQLITHELILVVMRKDRDGYEKNKEVAERSVRYLNGLIFKSNDWAVIGQEFSRRTLPELKYRFGYDLAIPMGNEFLAKLKAFTCASASYEKIGFKAQEILRNIWQDYIEQLGDQDIEDYQLRGEKLAVSRIGSFPFAVFGSIPSPFMDSYFMKEVCDYLK